MSTRRGQGMPAQSLPAPPASPSRSGAAGLLATDLLEHLRRMLGGVGHTGPVLADRAVGTDPDGGADHTLGLLAVHDLVAVRPPRRHDLPVGIGQKRERELVLRREFLV